MCLSNHIIERSNFIKLLLKITVPHLTFQHITGGLLKNNTITNNTAKHSVSRSNQFRCSLLNSSQEVGFLMLTIVGYATGLQSPHDFIVMSGMVPIERPQRTTLHCADFIYFSIYQIQALFYQTESKILTVLDGIFQYGKKCNSIH